MRRSIVTDTPAVRGSASSLFLLLIGFCVLVFSLFVSTPHLLEFIETSVRGGRVMDQDFIFWLSETRVKGGIFGGALCVIAVIRYFFGSSIHRFFSPGVASPPTPWYSWEKSVDLFLISFVALFAELLIIRWLSTEMRVFAYFKNIALISCFLGLGLGATLWNKREIHYSTFPFWFCLFAFIASFLGPRMIFLNPAGAQDYVWGIGAANSFASQFLASLLFFGIIGLMFVWNTFNFVFLGYVVGRELNNFSPLKAYTINILGSLIGIWGFVALSYYSSPPIVWFCVCLALFLWMLRRNRLQCAVMCGVGLLFLGYLFVKPEPHTLVWSPYYKITLIPSYLKSKISGETLFHGYSLKVNEDSHQTALDFSEDFFKKYGSSDDMEGKRVLEFPFRIGQFDSALIVGAGMGNDVAAALRSGVKNIDAVEIDPSILELGRKLHPEHPYQSPKVRAINDDARSYFKKTDKKYDTIVFGILDSHTQFSNMSSLRLDNYVYTIESIRDAQRLLKPGGVLSLTFSGDAQKLWMGPRFYRILMEVFGREPLALYMDRAVFAIGNGFDIEKSILDPSLKSMILEKKVSYPNVGEVKVSTDDWPFLYLKDKKIPNIYLFMLAFLGGISFLFYRGIVSRGVSFRETSFDGHFFFLGAAFLLIETKSISQLALVFGSTWTVNAIVFSGILILILLANLYVSVANPKRADNWYFLLFLSLVLNYFFQVGSVSEFSFWVKTAFSTAVVLLPIFFAAIIFALSFKAQENIPSAFGSNLLGAVVGGLSEYVSLSLGIKSLALLAMAFYVISYGYLKWGRRFSVVTVS